MAKSERRMGVLVGCGLLATSLPVASLSAATTLYDSMGFESRPSDPNHDFAPGAYLQGQPVNATSSTYQWTGGTLNPVSSGGFAYPLAAVYTYQSLFGSNSNPNNLQVADVSNGPGIGPTTVGAFYPMASLGANAFTPVYSNNTSVVDIKFTMAAYATTGDAFFGVVASNGNGQAIGELGINGRTGAVVGQSGAAVTLTPGAFYYYDLSLDFSSQTYTMYAAPATVGAVLVPIGSASFITPSTTFSAGALETFVLNSGDATSDGSGLFDDYSVTAVPEPATASLVMGGIAVAAFARRRRQLS